MKNLVELIDVSLSYGKTLAVSNLNMKVPEGSFAAVVGPSGCGKSSLMKLVTGLMPATTGAVVVDGHEISGPVSIVGMAFQNPNLLPWRTTLENVMLPLEVVRPERHQLRAKKKEFTERAMDLLRIVGLESFANHYPWQLSGGMQQRASLCRSLIHQPRLLMLDEPFGALDAFTREELWDVLQTIWLERRFTAILVTHDLREALYLADDVHVMSNRPGCVARTVNTGAFSRPRGEQTFIDPAFNENVMELRADIRAQRMPIEMAATGAPTTPARAAR
ncbi:NitT/TauT family transport system ATP-binding protein [Neorhizobium galegae]|uniref:ABC transporter ATP-binding protein n=1 Tax=Neorhizobium galegae TaxID=399 RepID=UPI001AE18859|nr:ABC transporter ATP-binding protein [Neorhizobium galegae]MBP2561852.1 NitT/TauT family transport system ATP-binding protein [Neorhizobium galegae]MDQ0134855.1 NitT/TauT family transport system ATP-binding protein [Neorhizobium galegae]